MSPRDNRSVYSAEEFEEWANRRANVPRLRDDERQIVERCFTDRDGVTLDGGTGGGRVALALRDAGQRRLHAFDFVPASIDQARRRDPKGTIEFRVMDATQLDYPAATFDQAIYPEQLLCFIEDGALRTRALRELHRVMKPGGIAIVTALSYEVRRASPTRRLFLNYLALLRKLRRSRRSPQMTPWLKLGGKRNMGALVDAAPHIYWYRIPELADALRAVGFSVEGMATSGQLARAMSVGTPMS